MNVTGAVTADLHAMTPTFQLDTSQFTAAGNELFRTSSRSCVDFINGQTLRVVIEAVRKTEKASADQIAWQLGQTGNQVRRVMARSGPSKGKSVFRKGKMTVAENSFASRILAKRFQLTGKWGVAGNTMEERVRNYIARAKKSAAFIASGWLPARKAFFNVVKKKPAGTGTSFAGVKQRGRPKGSGRPAAFALQSKIVAEALNTALKGNMPNPPAPGGNPMPVAVAGLQAALDFVAKDMMIELARRLGDDTRRFNA